MTALLLSVLIATTSMSDNIKTVVVVAATIVGIVSGSYALYQNWRKDVSIKEAAAATQEAKEEARRLADKTAAFTALEATVQSQGEVIVGLTQGLKDCIERDNAKAKEINEMRTEAAEQYLEIDRLKRKVAQLEGRR